MSSGKQLHADLEDRVSPETEVITPRDLEKYKKANYQYATTSRFNQMAPGAIVKVERTENHADIKAVIKYAKEVGDCQISVRSGGHQYLGYSSTTGRNIQIDMSNYNKTDFTNCEAEKGSTIVLDVGLKIKDLEEKLSEREIFYPHGFCIGVAMGGHLHTGGYGHFSSGFGLFIDHIQSFDIVTADGKVRTIRKPNTPLPEGEEKDDHNDDLWFSVLGGSPGNFGVVTSVKIKVIHDKEYEESKALARIAPLEKKALTKLLKIYEEIADDKNLSSNVQFGMITESAGASYRYHKVDKVDAKLDKCFLDCEKKFVKVKDDLMKILTPLLFSKWVGQAHIKVMLTFTGADRDPKAIENGLEAFEKFRNRIDGIADESIGRLKNFSVEKIWFSALNFVAQQLRGGDGQTRSGLSKICKNFQTSFDRVFHLPFQIRVWAGQAQDMGERGFAEWASDKVMEVEGEDPDGTYEGIKLSCSFDIGGCKGSKRAPPEFRTALAHRVPQMQTLTFNMSYQMKKKDGADWKEPLENGVKWLDRITEDAFNEKKNLEKGRFDDKERRFLYAPFLRNPKIDIPESPHNNVVLDDEQDYYYDNLEDYGRVLKTKTEIDPNNVFTPNCFCVGYTKMSKLRKDHEKPVKEFEVNLQEIKDGLHTLDDELGITYEKN